VKTYSHVQVQVVIQTITKFAFHEKQNVEAIFILNGSQNLAHGQFGKLHIFRGG
jgi:hypothetical protein